MRATPAHRSYLDAPPKLIAGEGCLDFLNTVEWRGDPEACGERLGDYGEFVLWAAAAGYVSKAEQARLLVLARRHPRRADAVLREAVRARESLARLLGARSGRDRGALPAFNRLLRRLRLQFRLALVDGRFRLIPAGRDELRKPLDRIILDAIDLVTSARLGAVGHCRNARCGWFFIDETRNRSRRWCDMATCGNNAKVRAYRQRVRAGGGGTKNRRAAVRSQAAASPALARPRTAGPTGS